MPQDQRDSSPIPLSNQGRFRVCDSVDLLPLHRLPAEGFVCFTNLLRFIVNLRDSFLRFPFDFLDFSVDSLSFVADLPAHDDHHYQRQHDQGSDSNDAPLDHFDRMMQGCDVDPQDLRSQ